jgi:hypothetical protein
MTFDSVLCLTGAGTNPALLTPHVTQELLAWPDYTAPSSSNDTVTDLIRSDPSDKRENFFVWLKEQTRNAFAHGDEANFEDLIHIAELAGGMLPLPPDPATRSFARFYGTGLFVPTPAAELIARKNVGHVAERAATFILRTIFERTRSITASDARDLIQHVMSSGGYRMQHFSLNYDTLAVPKGVRWWTGYEEGSGPQRFLFADAAPPGLHVNIQLHGSVNFAIDFGALIDACEIIRYDDPAEAAVHWGISGSGAEAMDRQASPRVPLIAGRRKAEKSLIEPFSSYMHYLRDAAFSTPNWLVLGYGGGDYHINRILQSAAAFWADKLRVLVCNYLPEDEFDWGTDEYSISPGCPAYDRLTTHEAGILKAFGTDVNAFVHEAGPLPTLHRGRANAIGRRVLLTVDGSYFPHGPDALAHLHPPA